MAAKALLDNKKQDHRVHDFLQRCLESPFSRKLDLWNFLDIPRSRLVKYPLLLREILKHTPNDHPDHQHLDEAVSITYCAHNHTTHTLQQLQAPQGRVSCLDTTILPSTIIHLKTRGLHYTNLEILKILLKDSRIHCTRLQLKRYACMLCNSQ